MLQTIQIVVSGKVQGVFYRHSTREVALGLGVTGTITNLIDGTVVIVATGTEDQLRSLVDWCKQGPRGAIVQSTSWEFCELKMFKDFTITK